MKRYILVILLINSVLIHAQELEKAPKQMSFEAGYRYMLENEVYANGATQGFAVLFDYAWQLSGYTPAKHPIYLSVPLGYSILPHTASTDGLRMLHYGWTVRHYFGHGEGLRPFMGYALLLNSISIDDREGQLFGHQTRFTFGTDFKGIGRLIPYTSLEYSMARHPQLDIAGSSWLHFIEVKAGIRINRGE